MTDHIDYVLTVMSASYGNRWRLDEDQKQVWRDGLQSFKRDELAQAMNDVRVDFPEWPPTLMEFRRYCMRVKPQREDSGEKSLIAKYNQKLDEYRKWRGVHIEPHKPGESAEDFRRRIVWQHELQRRRCTNQQLNEQVAENVEANKNMDWAAQMIATEGEKRTPPKIDELETLVGRG